MLQHSLGPVTHRCLPIGQSRTLEKVGGGTIPRDRRTRSRCTTWPSSKVMTTTTSSGPKPVLGLPPIEPAHYARNLIKQVVCEVRFPTIFEFAEDRPPSRLWNSLKKAYPHIESFRDYEIQGERLNNTVAGHQFYDKKRRWKVTIRPSTLTVETARYESFDEFRDRLLGVWDAAQSTLDTEFYTRVGLRYINTFLFDQSTVREWIRPELGALFAHPLGAVNEFMTKIAGPTDFGGGYIMQSGLVLNNSTKAVEFALDFDLYKEDVSIEDAPQLLTKLHDWEFRLFDWCLGPAARQHLGAPQRNENA